MELNEKSKVLFDQTKSNIARNVRDIREKKGSSQLKFSKTVNVHPNYIQKLESGECNITLNYLTQIATWLGLSVEDLISSPRT